METKITLDLKIDLEDLKDYVNAGFDLEESIRDYFNEILEDISIDNFDNGKEIIKKVKKVIDK